MMSATIIAILFICIAVSVALVMLFTYAIADNLSSTQIAFVSVVTAVIVILFITLFLQIANTNWLMDRLDQKCMDCKSAKFERFDPHSVHTFTVSTDVATTALLTKSNEAVKAAAKVANAIGVPNTCTIQPVMWVVNASNHAFDLGRYVSDGRITTVAVVGKMCRIGVMDNAILDKLSIDYTKKLVFVLVDMSTCVASPFNKDLQSLSSAISSITNAHVWAWASISRDDIVVEPSLTPGIGGR